MASSNDHFHNFYFLNFLVKRLVDNNLWDIGELELDKNTFEEYSKFLTLVEIEAALDELNKHGLVLLSPSGKYVITEKWINERGHQIIFTSHSE